MVLPFLTLSVRISDKEDTSVGQRARVRITITPRIDAVRSKVRERRKVSHSIIVLCKYVSLKLL
jgi:hypothetical protein